jgi:hypothetical protein
MITIETLKAAGLSEVQINRVLEAERVQRREQGKIRSQNYRDRHAKGVTRNAKNVTERNANNVTSVTKTAAHIEDLPLAKAKGRQAPPGDQERADLYHRAKQLCGPSFGGQVTKLLDRMQGSVPRARAIVENAAAAGNPAEYIGAVIRGRTPTVEQDTDHLILAWCKKNGLPGHCEAREIPLILEDMNGGRPYVRTQRNGHDPRISAAGGT